MGASTSENSDMSLAGLAGLPHFIGQVEIGHIHRDGDIPGMAYEAALRYGNYMDKR